MHEMCSIYFCVERAVKRVWGLEGVPQGNGCFCEGSASHFAVCLC